jgi:protein-S-isoprenylcysteine O-methyltransferase Ste14
MSQEIWIRLAVFLAMLATFTISGYFRTKADKTDRKVSTKEENQPLMHVRNAGALLMYGSILVFLVYPRLIAWGQLDLPLGLRWGAVALLYMMVPAFYWQLSSLNNNITRTVAIREQHQLITAGPYKYIRHPLYTFGFIFIITIAVAAASWWIFVLGLITWVPLAMRTPLEEQKLLEAFGDEYREYMQRTGRYIPKFF